MNEKQKAILFLDPTAAAKIGLQDVKIVAKNSRKSTPKNRDQ